MYGTVRTVVWADGRGNPPSDPISLRETFACGDNETQFWVGRGTSNRDTCTWFTLRMELNDIRVHGGGSQAASLWRSERNLAMRRGGGRARGGATQEPQQPQGFVPHPSRFVPPREKRYSSSSQPSGLRQ